MMKKINEIMEKYLGEVLNLQKLSQKDRQNMIDDLTNYKETDLKRMLANVQKERQELVKKHQGGKKITAEDGIRYKNFDLRERQLKTALSKKKSK